MKWYNQSSKTIIKTHFSTSPANPESRKYNLTRAISIQAPAVPITKSLTYLPRKGMFHMKLFFIQNFLFFVKAMALRKNYCLRCLESQTAHHQSLFENGPLRSRMLLSDMVQCINGNSSQTLRHNTSGTILEG